MYLENLYNNTLKTFNCYYDAYFNNKYEPSDMGYHPIVKHLSSALEKKCTPKVEAVLRAYDPFQLHLIFRYNEDVALKLIEYPDYNMISKYIVNAKPLHAITSIDLAKKLVEEKGFVVGEAKGYGSFDKVGPLSYVLQLARELDNQAEVDKLIKLAEYYIAHGAKVKEFGFGGKECSLVGEAVLTSDPNLVNLLIEKDASFNLPSCSIPLTATAIAFDIASHPYTHSYAKGIDREKAPEVLKILLAANNELDKTVDYNRITTWSIEKCEPEIFKMSICKQLQEPKSYSSKAVANLIEYAVENNERCADDSKIDTSFNCEEVKVDFTGEVNE